jgi:hypothetical protein
MVAQWTECFFDHINSHLFLFQGFIAAARFPPREPPDAADLDKLANMIVVCPRTTLSIANIARTMSISCI